MTGECQVMVYPAVTQLPFIRQDPSLDLVERNSLNTAFLALNTGKAPFNDVRVRQALAMAIDRQTLLQAVYYDSGQKADNLLLGVAWAGAVGLVTLGAGGSLLREWRLLRRLRSRQDERSRALDLLAQPSPGEGLAYCKQLARETGAMEGEGYQRWLADIDSHHNDAELLRLYSRQVLSGQDALAHACISRWSGEAAVLVAISPLASVDMLLILWRSLKMVEGIARCYGILV